MMTSLIMRKRLWRGLILLVVLTVSACRSQTPPGPTIVSYTLDQASCTFFAWQAGLRLMLWSDIIDNGSQNGASATGDPLFHQTGFAVAADGRRVDWELSTADGRSATLLIDQQEFDLTQGNLFLITTARDSNQIQQLRDDLAALPLTADGCQQIAKNNADVDRFIQDANHRAAQ